MPTTNEINRLNEIIGRDLGRNPFAEPIYAWKFSENLFHPMCISDPSRQSTYDFHALPSGIIVVEPKFELRPMCPQLDKQWLICQWNDSGSEAEWRAKFGTRLEWPRRGSYYETNVVLHPHEVPNMDLTEMFISAVRQQRKKTFADHLAEGYAISDRRDRLVQSEIDADFRDTLTAFGNIPGSRNTGVSLPSKEFRAGADAAFAATE